MTTKVESASEAMKSPGVERVSDRYSIAVPIGGFPQAIAPILNDIIQRVHGGGWSPEQVQPPTG